MQRISLLSAAALLSICGAVHAQSQVQATSNLNVRSGPGSNHPVIGGLRAGEAATLKGCLAGSKWCSITNADGDGWVNSDYLSGDLGGQVITEDQVAGAEAPAGSAAPLDADELEILVARIALYPDELIAVISAASLYPLQVVEAARFLDSYAKDDSLKPKEGWDGSVVSLLNYPSIVKMMSDDLEWTQAFGNAIAYQQKDLLIAIQQLRDEAIAKGIIKTDHKMVVTESSDNVVITSADPEVIYVPQYEPQMLYVEDYAPAPISYYPESYPNYWYPGATFFAGAITGAIWAGIVDWDDWGVWGGRWDGSDIDIDCNDCFKDRDFSGRVNFNDIDWANVDRDKINIERDQLANIDRDQMKNRIERNGENALRDRAKDIKRVETRDRPGKAGGGRDVRKSVQQGLKAQAGRGADKRGSAANAPNRKPAAKRDAPRSQEVRKGGKPKPAHRVDNRPRKPSGLGNPGRGKSQIVSSNRGHRSMGGGHRGGARHGGGRGGGRGGGGRGR